MLELLCQFTYLLDALQFRAESLDVAGAVVEQDGVAGHRVVGCLVVMRFEIM